MKKKKKNSLPFGQKCVRFGKNTTACLYKTPDHFGAWHEVTLAILLLLGIYLLKTYTGSILAPLVGDNPLKDPAVLLQPFVLVLVALLLVQKLWKSCILGFILSLTVAMMMICFLVILVAMCSLDAGNAITYFSIMLLPVVIFAVAVGMGKKYQNGICS
jgi:hypothetical protein